jgi:hypothetical protein
MRAIIAVLDVPPVFGLLEEPTGGIGIFGTLLQENIIIPPETFKNIDEFGPIPSLPQTSPHSISMD